MKWLVALVIAFAALGGLANANSLSNPGFEQNNFLSVSWPLDTTINLSIWAKTNYAYRVNDAHTGNFSMAIFGLNGQYQGFEQLDRVPPIWPGACRSKAYFSIYAKKGFAPLSQFKLYLNFLNASRGLVGYNEMATGVGSSWARVNMSAFVPKGAKYWQVAATSGGYVNTSAYFDDADLTFGC